MITAQNITIAACFARYLNMDEVVGNSFEVRDGRFGEAVRPYCYREGKIHWAQKFATAKKIPLERCAFFSDSINDVPLLSLVGHAVTVNPDRALEERARREGWTVASFTTPDATAR
jgi:phosphoserine phosphatase